MSDDKGFCSGIYTLHNVEITVRNSMGVKERRYIHNHATQDGLQGIASMLLPTPDLPKMAAIALGKDSSLTDTELGNEVFRAALTSFVRVGITVELRTTISAASLTTDLTEAGIFDSSSPSSGLLWFYTEISPAVSITAGDDIEVLWVVSLGATLWTDEFVVPQGSITISVPEIAGKTIQLFKFGAYFIDPVRHYTRSVTNITFTFSVLEDTICKIAYS